MQSATRTFDFHSLTKRYNFMTIWIDLTVNALPHCPINQFTTLLPHGSNTFKFVLQDYCCTTNSVWIPNQTKTLFDQQLTTIWAMAETGFALPSLFRGVTKSLIVKINSKLTKILFRTSCENVTFGRKTCRRNCETSHLSKKTHNALFFQRRNKTLIAKVNSKYTRILFTTSCDNVKQEKISTKLRKHMHLIKEDMNEWSDEWSTSDLLHRFKTDFRKTKPLRFAWNNTMIV